jgi:hypothetical protein
MTHSYRVQLINRSSFQLFRNILLLSIALTLSSCWPVNNKYEQGELPETPVNLQDFNSEYDDYNSTAPSLGYLIPFCFSTNRKSQGADFDVVYMPMNVNFAKSTGELKVSNQYDNWGIRVEDYGVLLQAVKKINTTGNEFGPYLMPEFDDHSGEFKFVLLYATDKEGDFEICYTYNTDSSGFSEPIKVGFLSSKSNELYPTFDSSFSKLYFCSDREQGMYNIFYADLDSSMHGVFELLSNTGSHQIEVDPILSSDQQDKCPYIFGNTMVFSSDRTGGFGGYDLYYSKFSDGQWGAPVNFGEAINTEYDEYRPILFDEGVDNNRNMMVFSSDRPGGLGGFDLYFVGVLKQ